MSAATKAREGLTNRLRAMEARELPREVQFRTNITLHSDGNHMIAGFVMGAGFTREVAQEIARRVNAHEDLLAACEALLGWAESIRPRVGVRMGDANTGARDMARAAIAKARGQ